MVCGGRKYRDAKRVFLTLDRLHVDTPLSLLVHGGANGADSIAGAWAAAAGVKCEVCEANWAEYGRKAGPMRNQAMIDIYEPRLVVAFPGGRGTADMVMRAVMAGVNVLVVEG